MFAQKNGTHREDMGIHSFQANMIIEHSLLEPGMNVLDAGCGPGRLTIPFARRVGGQGLVVAMDIQSGMLSRFMEKSSTEGFTNIEFLHVRLGQNKRGKNRFDRALLVTVLGEIPGRENAIREIFDALKPGGVLSITEVIFDPHFQRRSFIARLGSKSGLEMKEILGNRIAFTMIFQKPTDNTTGDK